MKKKTPQPRAMRKKDFPKFDETLYLKATLDSLVLFAFYTLIERRIEFALEDLVSACFRLFPKKFALKKFSRWPDSAAVSRHWQECRRKKRVVAGGDFQFRLTAKGTRIVRQTAKTLGVEIPKPKRVEPVVKKIVPSITKEQVKPTVEKPKRAKPVAKKAALLAAEKSNRVKPVVKKVVPPVAKEQVKPTVEKPKRVKPVVKKAAPPAAEKSNRVKPVVKKVVPPVAKEQVKPTVEKPKRVKPVVKKAASPVAKELSKVEVKPMGEKPKRAKPAAKKVALSVVEQKPKAEQLPLPHPKPAPKKKAEPDTTIWKEKIHPPAPTVAAATQPKKETSPAQPVSPEAWARAGKFVRMMETSDAYVQYKKQREKSNINEFDFRSLLLCTMESSPETLARNVEQFKGYAAVHNRGDLVAFLDFCASRFSHLLIPQKKAARGKR